MVDTQDCADVWALLRRFCHLRPALRIDLQFVPSHCGILCNERADAAAEQASFLPQLDIPIAMDAQLEVIFRHIKRNWTSTFNAQCPRGRVVGMDPQPHSNTLSRMDERLLAQLRTAQCSLIGRLHHRLHDGSPPSSLSTPSSLPLSPDPNPQTLLCASTAYFAPRPTCVRCPSTTVSAWLHSLSSLRWFLPRVSWVGCPSAYLQGSCNCCLRTGSFLLRRSLLAPAFFDCDVLTSSVSWPHTSVQTSSRLVRYT